MTNKSRLGTEPVVQLNCNVSMIGFIGDVMKGVGIRSKSPAINVATPMTHWEQSTSPTYLSAVFHLGVESSFFDIQIVRFLHF